MANLRHPDVAASGFCKKRNLKAFIYTGLEIPRDYSRKMEEKDYQVVSIQ